MGEFSANDNYIDPHVFLARPISEYMSDVAARDEEYLGVSAIEHLHNMFGFLCDELPDYNGPETQFGNPVTFFIDVFHGVISPRHLYPAIDLLLDAHSRNIPMICSLSACLAAHATQVAIEERYQMIRGVA